MEFCGGIGVEELLVQKFKFRHNPKGWPEHKVLGRAHDGTTITVGMAEMVMNDAFVIDMNRGAGRYEQAHAKLLDSVSLKTHEALVKAKDLYGCEPIDLHAGGA